MRWRKILMASALAAGCVTSTGPVTTPTSPGSSLDTCDHTKVQWTIGQPAGDELLERARVAAGAGSARFLRPNQPITMEYLGSRLNLGLDERDIVRATVCG